MTAPRKLDATFGRSWRTRPAALRQEQHPYLLEPVAAIVALHQLRNAAARAGRALVIHLAPAWAAYRAATAPQRALPAEPAEALSPGAGLLEEPSHA